MDRMKWLTEGGFSNAPIRRGEACLAHIPSPHFYQFFMGWCLRDILPPTFHFPLHSFHFPLGANGAFITHSVTGMKTTLV